MTRSDDSKTAPRSPPAPDTDSTSGSGAATSAGHASPITTLETTRPAPGRWALVAVAAFGCSLYGFGWFVATLQGRSFEPVVVTPASLPGTLEAGLLLVAALLLVVLPHELVHGLALSRYGGRPSLEFSVTRFVVPYASVATGRRYRRTELVIALLAPLVVISGGWLLVALTLEATWPLALAAINVSGSVGDCWLAGRLLRYPSSVTVGPLPSGGTHQSASAHDGDDSVGQEDSEGGSVAVFGDIGSPGPYARFYWPFVVGAVGTVAAVVACLVALVFGSLAVGDGTVLLGAADGSWLLVRHERVDPTGAVIELGVTSLVTIGVGGGLSWTALLRFRDR